MSPGIETPLVSIILPTYNRVELLASTLGSVFSQTMQDWELIIADDGSNAETRAYLLTRNSPRVRVIWLAHTGVPAIVRNAALREARGEYVAFLDSDDLWSPRKLEAQIEILRNRADCRWSCTAFTHIDAHGDVLVDGGDTGFDSRQDDIFERLITGDLAVRTPSVLASRQLITDAGSFDETMRSAEDYDLWTRLALRSAVAILDEALVQVRVHQGNLSNDWSSAFAGRDHFLLKLQGLVHGPRLALLKRERARNAARLATLHAVGGNHRTALQALWNSVPYAWPYLDWWKGVARSVVRPHLPARLMDIYRGYRNGP